MNKNKAYRLDNWSLCQSNPYQDNQYTAPELLATAAAGIITSHDHPKFVYGDPIITSAIVDISGRYLQTHSGTIYYLGNISPKYRKYLRQHNPSWDWRRPVTIKKNKGA